MRPNWKFAPTCFTIDTRKSPLTMESLPDMIRRLEDQRRQNNRKLVLEMLTVLEDAKQS